MVPNVKIPQYPIHCQFVDDGVNRRQSGSMDVYAMPPELLHMSCEDGHRVVLRYDVVNVVFEADFHDRMNPCSVLLVFRNWRQEMRLVHWILEPFPIDRCDILGKIAGRVKGVNPVVPFLVEDGSNLTASGCGAIRDQDIPEPKPQVAFVLGLLFLAFTFNALVVESQIGMGVVYGGT